MKLNFLGNRYQATPDQLPVVDSRVGGKYRGQVWTKKKLQSPPTAQPARYLKYRGANYLTFSYNVNINYEIEYVPEHTVTDNLASQVVQNDAVNEHTMEEIPTNSDPVVNR